jgi:hypothetical protein
MAFAAVIVCIPHGLAADGIRESAPISRRSSTLNCAPNPSSCGYPDATNTGVPTGTTLTASGDVTVTTNGAVISELDIRGAIDVLASNVTIQKLRIVNSGTWGIIVRSGSKNVTIQDVEIHGVDGASGEMQYAVLDQTDGQEVHITRANFSNCSDCVQGDATLLEDSYIHDFGFVDGDHTDGFQSNGGGGAVIRHNTIFLQLGQTGAISLFQDFGVQANDTIANNLIAGGGYTIYGGDGTKGQSSHICIVNNRFSRIFYPDSGFFGPAAYFDSSGTGNFWHGNLWDDTGATVDSNNPSHTTTVLTSDHNPSNLGQTVTLTATVTTLEGCAATPTGAITFKDGGATIGTGSLAGGVATFVTNALSLGSHSLTAVYGGDADSGGSTSNVLMQSVNGGGGASADIGVTAMHSPSRQRFAMGDEMTETLTVTNHDASNPAQVALNVTSAPSRIEIDSASAPDGDSCSVTGPSVQCSIPSLAAGSSAVFTLKLRPLIMNSRTLSVTATVSSNTTDSNLANNTALDVLQVAFKPFRQ